MKKTPDNSIYLTTQNLPDFPLWERARSRRKLLSFNLEITARCNNDCRHCYINLPANNKEAQKEELSLVEIKKIADQALDLGAIWCLITGGEPLLREDFFDIYLYLKKKGLLVSVFTNATLLTKEHIDFLKKYPPHDFEVTVYGVKRETYEKVSRRPGSFDKFIKGLNLLLENNINVRLKAMALRSNVHELAEIAKFCRERTKDYFRFDPFLQLRFDNNENRNREICSERLSPEEIVEIEQKDPERFGELEKACDRLIMSEVDHRRCNHLFHCGAGNGFFYVTYNGFLRLCPSLCHNDCIYDLKKGTVSDAYNKFIPHVRDMRSDKKEFLENCRNCNIVNLCMWCPANSHLETGELDMPVDYFCKVAHARKDMLERVIAHNK